MEPIVKTASFVDLETGRLVIHLVNITNKPAEFDLNVASEKYRQATFHMTRTSKEHAQAEGDAVSLVDGAFQGKLSTREMLTLETTPELRVCRAQSRGDAELMERSCG